MLESLNFPNSRLSSVCLLEHAVFPQIVLSGLGIAAPWNSWWEESAQLKQTFSELLKNFGITHTIIYLAPETEKTFHALEMCVKVICLNIWEHGTFCLHQVDLLKPTSLLNVFSSQLCSPFEENLWGRSTRRGKQTPQHKSIIWMFVSDVNAWNGLSVSATRQCRPLAGCVEGCRSKPTFLGSGLMGLHRTQTWMRRGRSWWPSLSCR